jgi:predicted acetyltransferase
MNIEILETTLADRPLLSNLIQFYLYDFSEFADFPIEPDGRYSDDDLDGCWVDPWRFTFVLKVEEELAGFAIVDDLRAISQDEPVIDMGEFFVMRKFRRQGIGSRFAIDLFERFIGKWRVRQIEENTDALAFWRKVIDIYTGGNFLDTTWHTLNRSGTVQYFDNSL